MLILWRTEKATQKVKETAGMSSGEVKGKMKEAEGTAKGKANEVSHATLSLPTLTVSQCNGICN